MIASVLRLNRADIKNLKITDDYSLHRVVYSLFDDVRTSAQKAASQSSGILYADKGGDFNSRQILLLSNRHPRQPEHGEIASRDIPDNFLQHGHYRFEVVINPTKCEKQTGKNVAIKGRVQIAQWFIDKAPKRWGFTVNPVSLQVNSINVKMFDKKGHGVTLGTANLQGELTVIDRNRFIESFTQGIGRGRAFGCGLLQIVPQSNPFNL